jgi:hypothetical protein
MFENRGINFRVVSWQFGQTVNNTTVVVLQGLSMNEEELYKVESEIKDFCASEDVKCQAVQGPSYEAQLPHQVGYDGFD